MEESLNLLPASTPSDPSWPIFSILLFHMEFEGREEGLLKYSLPATLQCPHQSHNSYHSGTRIWELGVQPGVTGPVERGCGSSHRPSLENWTLYPPKCEESIRVLSCNFKVPRVKESNCVLKVPLQSPTPYTTFLSYTTLQCPLGLQIG